MRKGFAQAVSIVVGSTAITTAAAPLSQPRWWFRSTTILISEKDYLMKLRNDHAKGTSESNKGIT